MNELLDFFSKAPEQNDLLSFSSNPFDEVDEYLHGANDSSNVLDTILKHGQILRIRPDPEYYKDYRATYTSNGNVIFENKEMSMLEFLRQSREMYRELHYYTGNIPQTRVNSNPLKYIEAYVNNKWTFLSKLINPKSYIDLPFSFELYIKDVRHIYYNIIEKDFNYLLLNAMIKKIKIFEEKWWKESLPSEWIESYDQLLDDLFLKEEPVSTVPIIPVEFVQSVMNGGAWRAQGT